MAEAGVVVRDLEVGRRGRLNLDVNCPVGNEMKLWEGALALVGSRSARDW